MKSSFWGKYLVAVLVTGCHASSTPNENTPPAAAATTPPVSARAAAASATIISSSASGAHPRAIPLPASSLAQPMNMAMVPPVNVAVLVYPGVELEAVAVPTKGLEVSWNAAVNHARYAELPLFNYTDNRTQSYAGNQPINTPVVTSMLAAQYTYALGQGKQQPALFVRGEWRYLGHYYFDYYNQDGQNAYGIVNARTGVSVRHLELAFWIRNAFDRTYLTYGSLSAQSPTYLQSLPRFLGTTLTA